MDGIIILTSSVCVETEGTVNLTFFMFTGIESYKEKKNFVFLESCRGSFVMGPLVCLMLAGSSLGVKW